MRSPESDLQLLRKVPVTSELTGISDLSWSSRVAYPAGWWRHHIGSPNVVGRLAVWTFKATMVTKASMVFGVSEPVTSAVRNLAVLYVKCPLLLSDFNRSWNVWTVFSRSPLPYQISWKPFQRFSSCCTRTDIQTDMTKLVDSPL